MSAWYSDSTPMVLGHRGAMAHAPENTMAAFHLALEQKAVGFEFDVHLSSDGVPVIIHDSTLDRTTNGSGPVNQMTVEALRTLDAGSGEQIPLLEQLFQTFGDSVLYNVEIKAYSLRPNGVEAAVAALVEKYGLAQKVLVSSFNFLNMHRYRALNHKNVPLAMIRYPGPQALSRHIFNGAADHPHFSMVDEGYMAWANANKKRVHVWTVNEPEEAERLKRLGVHGIVSNNPGEILAAIG